MLRLFLGVPKYIYITTLVIGLAFGAYKVHTANIMRIEALETELERVNELRRAEILHNQRERERLDALRDMEAQMERNNVEAENDHSDSGSSFGASRVRRLNAIR